MKCSFCDKNIEQGTGVMLIHNDGKINYFCSKKCEINMIKLGRESKDVKWITKKSKK
jgi:large subunit ribosomal protein L24e